MARITLTPALFANFVRANTLPDGAAKKAAKKAAWAAVRTAFPLIHASAKLGFDDADLQVYMKGSSPRVYLDDGVVAPAAAPQAADVPVQNVGVAPTTDTLEASLSLRQRLNAAGVNVSVGLSVPGF